MVDLDKIKLGYSALTKDIYMYHHGKNERVALDKREAKGDVLEAFVEFMMDGSPNGAEIVVLCGNKTFEIRVKPEDDTIGEETLQ